MYISLGCGAQPSPGRTRHHTEVESNKENKISNVSVGLRCGPARNSQYRELSWRRRPFPNSCLFCCQKWPIFLIWRYEHQCTYLGNILILWRGSLYLNLLTRIYVIRCVQSRSHIASFLGREGTRAPGLIDTVLLHLEQLSAAADLGTDWILASEVIQQIDWFISIDVKNIQEQ